MARRRLPRAVEVVGHEVEVVDVRREPLEVEVRDLVVSRRRRHRDAVTPAELGAERIELLTHELEKRRIVRPVVRAHGVAVETTAARILPVEVDAVEHPVGLEEVHERGGERLAAGRRGADGAEVRGERPAAHGHAHLHVRVFLLELGELVEVAPDCLRGPRVARRVVPLIGLARHCLASPEPLLDCGEAVEEGHLAVALEVQERIDEMVELVGRNIGHLEVAAVDAPFGEVGRQHLVERLDRLRRARGRSGRGRRGRRRCRGRRGSRTGSRCGSRCGSRGRRRCRGGCHRPARRDRVACAVVVEHAAERPG